LFILLLHVWIKKLKPLNRKAKLEAFAHLHRVIDIDDKFSGLSLTLLHEIKLGRTGKMDQVKLWKKCKKKMNIMN